MDLSREQIDTLVNAVASRLSGKSTTRTPESYGKPGPVLKTGARATSGQAAPRASTGAVAIQADEKSVAYATLDLAVAAAQRAQPKWAGLAMVKRKEIIAKMRLALAAKVEDLSQLAVQETGLGRVEDKRSKNLLVINKTPGPEYLEAQAFTGDDGLALVEYAPYGIIGAITPTTNPSETIINNGISMLSAGNAVVFNPHPSAKRISLLTMEAS